MRCRFWGGGGTYRWACVREIGEGEDTIVLRISRFGWNLFLDVYFGDSDVQGFEDKEETNTHTCQKVTGLGCWNLSLDVHYRVATHGQSRSWLKIFNLAV
jgi:hypothetical protein